MYELIFDCLSLFFDKNKPFSHDGSSPVFVNELFNKSNKFHNDNELA